MIKVTFVVKKIFPLSYRKEMEIAFLLYNVGRLAYVFSQLVKDFV